MQPTSTTPRDMADDAVLSPADDGLSPDSGIEITMEEGSDNSKEYLDQEDFDFESSEDNQLLKIKTDYLDNQGLGIEIENQDTNNNRNTHIQPPVEGMEFESYEDAYNHYNSYAKALGFGIRVKSSWTKRNSKDKRGAVLCCNCEGFKTMKEGSTRRKETRTGCLAMIRLRLVESSRWRCDEAKLEHNHLFDSQRAETSRSHKKTEVGVKRKSELALDLEVQTIKLYRTPHEVDSSSSNERENLDYLKRLEFKDGDGFEVVLDFFRRAQTLDPNFFYIMDLNDDGYLRNVFWVGSRSRAAYGYFGDVVMVETTNKDGIPFVSFVGVNHHCQPLLFGCGLIFDESMETYVWLMRTWLSCVHGRPPQTIITDECKALSVTVSEVFPRANHCLYPPLIMKCIYEKLGELGHLGVFRTVLNRTVYESNRVEEFEIGWEEMVRHFGIKDHEWIRSIYEDRERWVPAYLKKTAFFAGIFTFRLEEKEEQANPFLHGYLHNLTTLNDLFTFYESRQQKMIQKEALDDYESREFMPVLKTSCSYEFSVSQFYTKEIFLKFQEEVALMANCFSVTQVHTNGPLITYIVRERDPNMDPVEAESFEVVYDKVGLEVRCMCGCFNLGGYLCRHALSVLNLNGVEEIPDQYVLPRWRRDVKRLYCPDLGSESIDISNPVQWYEHLYRRAVQVVTVGMASEDNRTVAWQAIKDSLDKVRLVGEKRL